MVIEEGPVIESLLTMIACPRAPVLNEVAVASPPMMASFVIAAESSVEAPAVSPASVVAPVTSSVDLRSAAFVTSSDSTFAFAVVSSTPRVDLPVTPSVEPTVAAPVTSADASVEAPAVSPASVVYPVTY